MTKCFVRRDKIPDFLLEKSDQLLPFKDGSDGAFAALLRQNSSS